MIYTTLTIGGNEYKLRLTAAKMIEVEKALANNPLNILMDMASGDVPKLPKMADILTIFWGALTHYQHGIGKDQAYALYDQYVEEGGSYDKFINEVIMPAFRSAGYINDNTDDDTDGAEKNE